MRDDCRKTEMKCTGTCGCRSPWINQIRHHRIAQQELVHDSPNCTKTGRIDQHGHNPCPTPVQFLRAQPIWDDRRRHDNQRRTALHQMNLMLNISASGIGHLSTAPIAFSKCDGACRSPRSGCSKPLSTLGQHADSPVTAQKILRQRCPTMTVYSSVAIGKTVFRFSMRSAHGPLLSRFKALFSSSQNELRHAYPV